MIKLACRTDDGRETNLEVPSHVSEISLKDYIDFKREKDQYSELTDEDKADQSFTHLIKAVSVLVKGDLTIIPAGDLSADQIDAAIEGKGVLSEVSIVRLYAYLIWLINSYWKSTDKLIPGYCVMYKGKDYYLTQGRSELILTREAFTVGEVLEVEETNNWFERAKKAKGDPDGNFEFMADCAMMAVLLRPKGHELPINPEEREKYINKMGQHFQDLSLDVVLDVRFFLLSTLRNSVIPVGIQFFSKGSPISGPLRTPSKLHVRTREQKPGLRRNRS